MDKKEQTRLRVQRHRAKNSVTPLEAERYIENDKALQKLAKGVTDVTQSPENVTQGVTQYHPLIYALTDPDKRRKLEKIYRSLREHNQDKNVYYGYPDKGVSFDIIGEMLEVTG